LILKRIENALEGIKMNDSDDLFIKCKKNELINLLDSGMIKEAVQQFALVDGFVLDVFRLFDGDKRIALEKYLHDQNKLKEKIKTEGMVKADLDEKLTKLVEEYGKNAQEMYKEIKKL